ncbi:uncharacterized protein LOC134439453 [Engraulis encrasicolus]|uniref:uncharacterized protein LOC134439453 n=1 Tax=Engraulis encrasicolus TaxID=184585 RepID=UPI002FD484F7
MTRPREVVYMANRRGPSTDPWATPVERDDYSFPSNYPGSSHRDNHYHGNNYNYTESSHSCSNYHNHSSSYRGFNHNYHGCPNNNNYHVYSHLQSSIRYRQANTEAEIQVEFDQNAPENAPTSSDVALAIKQEASSTSNPIDVDLNNIEVTRAPQVMSNAQFTTSENFVLSLLSINSTSYRNRAALIKEELEPFFHEDYSPDFICLTPETFSVGTVHSNSILHQSELHFTYNATLPSATDVYNTMLRAARSGKLSINIISVDGKDVSASSSGDVSSKISLFTTCCLTLLSLLLIRPW